MWVAEGEAVKNKNQMKEGTGHLKKFRGENVLSEFRESVSWRMVKARWVLTFNNAYISAAQENITTAMLYFIFD